MLARQRFYVRAERDSISRPRAGSNGRCKTFPRRMAREYSFERESGQGASDETSCKLDGSGGDVDVGWSCGSSASGGASGKRAAGFAHGAKNGSRVGDG